MIEGININERVEFSLSTDVTEPKTVFVLRPLSGLELMKFSDFTNPDMLRKYLDLSIIEIKNGERSVIDRLNPRELNELAGRCFSLNNLLDEDKKKS